MNRIVIFAGGERPDLCRCSIDSSDRIFAADRGANYALAAGFLPDLVIGDLDSISEETLATLTERGVPIERYPVDKDATDLELTLLKALRASPPPQEILLVGTLGDAIDHLLGGLLLLSHPEALSRPEIALTVVHGSTVIAVVRGGERRTLPAQPGEIVSLIALGSGCREVTLTGVQWPLSAADIAFGGSRTLRNRAVNREINVQVGSGTLLLVHLAEASR